MRLNKLRSTKALESILSLHNLTSESGAHDDCRPNGSSLYCKNKADGIMFRKGAPCSARFLCKHHIERYKTYGAG